MGRKSLTDDILKKKKKGVAPVAEAAAPGAKKEKPVAPVSPLEGIDWDNITKEQLAKLVADYTKSDPYNLKGLNPRFRYRFLRRQDDNLDRKTMKGWQIVTGPEAEAIAKASGIRTRQGQVHVGDGVLAKIPMELFVAIRAHLKKLSDRGLGTITTTLRRDMGSKYARNVEESLKVRDRGLPEKVEK